MPVPQPSQYQVDNMQQGDIIYIKKQKLLYRWYRNLFLNKPKIRVKQFWGSVDYKTVYQEDCTLLYYFEVMCVQNINNEVPVVIGRDSGTRSIYTTILKTLQVGLYNTMLVFPNGLTITLPTDYIGNSIRQNQHKLKKIEDARMVQEALKFQRYKGNYFKSYVEQHNIDRWVSAYCSVCGKPVEFIFNDDDITVNNNCKCGELKLDMKTMSYDELSIWYYNQTSPAVKKIYDKFWFGKE